MVDLFTTFLLPRQCPYSFIYWKIIIDSWTLKRLVTDKGFGLNGPLSCLETALGIRFFVETVRVRDDNHEFFMHNDTLKIHKTWVHYFRCSTANHLMIKARKLYIYYSEYPKMGPTTAQHFHVRIRTYITRHICPYIRWYTFVYQRKRTLRPLYWKAGQVETIRGDSGCQMLWRLVYSPLKRFPKYFWKAAYSQCLKIITNCLCGIWIQNNKKINTLLLRHVLYLSVNGVLKNLKK